MNPTVRYGLWIAAGLLVAWWLSKKKVCQCG